MTLTKTRFALALECPRKLDYARDKEAYYDERDHNELLESLAEGGHQVGELARRMFPGGQLIAERSSDDQVSRTSVMLTRPEVTLFEATIQHENLLVRADVLEKKGNQVRLIEVKAKGYDAADDHFASKKRGGEPIISTWRPYLYDVAYQAYVLGLAHPELKVTPYLLLLDKTVVVDFDGLNTMLPVAREGRNVTVNVAPSFDVGQLDPPILRLIDVSAEVRLLLNHPLEVAGPPRTFSEFVAWASGFLGAGASFPTAVGSQCKKCQYYVDPKYAPARKRSGWTECMQVHAGMPTETRRPDTVFGLYKIHPGPLNKLLANEPLLLAEVSEALLGDKRSTDEITLDQRQRLQLAEAQGDIEEPFILHAPLRTALATWQWPLHFIDFETSRPALPYARGRTPYDQILFQFSHHVMDAQGRVEHRHQCLEATPGVAPSVLVLRALRDALAGDDGTVVHWWTHEDTVLKEIREHVAIDKPTDGEALMTFVDSLVGSAKGPRRLRDLGKLVSKLVFYPGTAGSSSIKKVLPAALRHSKPLRDRYGAPVYGTKEMPSLNFKDWVWVESQNGVPQDPYALLEPLIDDLELREAIAAAEEDDTGEAASFINNGGAAIIAYDQLQQAGLPAAERQRVTTELLRYCELDTLAMVMVYQSLTGHGLRKHP